MVYKRLQAVSSGFCQASSCLQHPLIWSLEFLDAGAFPMKSVFQLLMTISIPFFTALHSSFLRFAVNFYQFVFHFHVQKRSKSCNPCKIATYLPKFPSCPTFSPCFTSSSGCFTLGFPGPRCVPRHPLSRKPALFAREPKAADSRHLTWCSAAAWSNSWGD